jgi:hypothetical protein
VCVTVGDAQREKKKPRRQKVPPSLLLQKQRERGKRKERELQLVGESSDVKDMPRLPSHGTNNVVCAKQWHNEMQEKQRPLQMPMALGLRSDASGAERVIAKYDYLDDLCDQATQLMTCHICLLWSQLIRTRSSSGLSRIRGCETPTTRQMLPFSSCFQ